MDTPLLACHKAAQPPHPAHRHSPCLALHGLVLAAHSLVPFYPGRSQPPQTRPPQGSRTFSGRRQGTLFHCYYTLLPISFTVTIRYYKLL